MRRVLLEVAAALRNIGTVTFVDPVRQGRPQPREWPRGLAAIGAATLLVYVLLAAAATFAVDIRQSGDLTASASSGHTLPTAALPLLLTGLILSFALAHTAALHTSWWLRITLFLLGAAATLFFTTPAFDSPLLLVGSAAAYLVLLVFTLAR
ncbi:MAG: hypothetical protein AAGC63_16820, partial [Propionicimonas sp.]|nr:hypothetical protein [Propionicimonas sp.]